MVARVSDPEPTVTIDPPPDPGMDDTKEMLELLTLECEATEAAIRPYAPRRSTHPALPASPTRPVNKPLPLHARNRSPYARSHLRSWSSASSLTSPPMVRAHSSPIVDTFGHVHMPPDARPSSPLFTSHRRQSPLRRPLDEAASPASTHTTFDVSETIAENSELHLTPRATTEPDVFLPSPLSIHHTFPRSRKRPSSPLHNIVQQSSVSYFAASPLHTSTSSPTLAAKFNESYPSSLSSFPSTPTSFRSRSPSISSLETIPDSPDAEEEAQEADTVASLKAAAEREEGEREGRRRGSLDVPGRLSGGFGGRDKRKRWSVCGAERRGDLDLETIWED
ncbi:hypothetical protein MMC19_004122 [Ptychographa xylographoides]|nr:hypothetical protein [Ptychographa xylographoides]